MKDDYLRKAIVRRVIDGDTIDVSVDLGFTVWVNQRLRLARIDAPEVRGKERPRGLKTKHAVTGLLGKSVIFIQTFKAGKYGRYIADVWFQRAKYDSDCVVSANGSIWTNLSDLLLKMKLAKPYRGKK